MHSRSLAPHYLLANRTGHRAVPTEHRAPRTEHRVVSGVLLAPASTNFPGDCALKITIISDDAIRFEAQAGPLTIEADSAERSYGPFHMLGSSLAYCTYSVLQSWASHAGVTADSLVVDVLWKFAENPHRVGEFSVSLKWPGLPPERLTAARRVAALCAVHKTLTNPPAIAVEVNQ